MKKLTHGIMHWNKIVTGRTPVRQPTSEETYDYEKAISSIHKNNKPKIRVFTDFKKTTARDELLLNTTDNFKNVQLENTKEEREIEIESRKTSPFKGMI